MSTRARPEERPGPAAPAVAPVHADAPRPADDDAPASASSRLRQARRVWGLAALICLTAGLTFTAAAVAGEVDASREQARQAFDEASRDVAAQLRIDIQRHDDLVVSAAAFAAGNPDATTAEFAHWVDSVRAVERYPELLGITIVRVVTPEEVPEYAELIGRDPAIDLAPGEELEVIPPGERAFHCFLQAVGYRAPGAPDLPPGFDYCAEPSLGAIVIPTRVSAVSAYQTGVEVNGEMPLIITTPTYEGGVTPGTAASRNRQALGGIATVVDVQSVLEEALADRSHMSATLRYADRFSDVSFETSDAAAHADGDSVETQQMHLLPGWTLTIRTDAVSTASVLTGSALGLLLPGILAPVLLAVLLFTLGTGQARALDQVDAATEELRHQALHDPLTGLPNRGLIADRTEALLARARAGRTVPAAMFVDLDGFKEVNDSLGHGAGDDLLVVASERLTAALRDIDTIGRLGGDEFIVLVDGDTGIDPVVVAERLLEAMREPFLLRPDAAPVRVTASVGIATGLRDDAGELLRDADVALYEAKTAGRDCWRVFDPDMDHGGNTAGALGVDA